MYSLMVSSSCSTVGTLRGTGTIITNPMIIHNYSYATVKMWSILSSSFITLSRKTRLLDYFKVK